MVELPQETIPYASTTEVTELPPVEVSSLPTIAVEVTATGVIQTQQIPEAGLTRLYGPAQPDFEANSPRVDLLYTVPASPPHYAVLRQIVFVNTSNTSSWITIGINGVAHPNLILHQYAIAGNSFNVINFYGIKLTAGETIQGYQQHSGDNTVTILGEELPV